MEKIDYKKMLKPLFSAPVDRFVSVKVPPMQFLKVDGEGNPNTSPAYRDAVEWLYGVSFSLKFAAKAGFGRDYVVPPLEGLWWADDPAHFVTRQKDMWRWTMMIMAPDFITDEMFAEAVRCVALKREGARPPESLRLEIYAEGEALQALHVGSYDDEGPLLARLHHEVMPQAGLTFNGPHHEIYLSDPRKTEARKLKTLLRQPVRPL